MHFGRQRQPDTRCAVETPNVSRSENPSCCTTSARQAHGLHPVGFRETVLGTRNQSRWPGHDSSGGLSSSLRMRASRSSRRWSTSRVRSRWCLSLPITRRNDQHPTTTTSVVISNSESVILECRSRQRFEARHPAGGLMNPIGPGSLSAHPARIMQHAAENPGRLTSPRSAGASPSGRRRTTHAARGPRESPVPCPRARRHTGLRPPFSNGR